MPIPRRAPLRVSGPTLALGKRNRVELKDYWLTVRRRWRVVVAYLRHRACGRRCRHPPDHSAVRVVHRASSCPPSDRTPARPTRATCSPPSAWRRTPTWSAAASWPTRSRTPSTASSTRAPHRGRSRATVVPETVILEITATHPDPEVAATSPRPTPRSSGPGRRAGDPSRASPTPSIKATIVDDAEVSDDAVSPSRCATSPSAARPRAAAGLGLAVARELLDTSLTTSDDIADVTDAPILGNIATDEPPTWRRSRSLSSATPWAEAFRVLRTNMQYVEVDEDQKVIVMTSSLPGEGKSTTAINLALTTAMAGQRVVLVEADLRRPLIAEPPRAGRRRRHHQRAHRQGVAADALQEYADTGLQVLACGPIPPNPSELLQSHRHGGPAHRPAPRLRRDHHRRAAAAARSRTPRCSRPRPTAR